MLMWPDRDGVGEGGWGCCRAIVLVGIVIRYERRGVQEGRR